MSQPLTNAQLLSQAFAAHERSHHTTSEADQIPMDCFADVVARYEALRDRPTADAYESQLPKDAKDRDWYITTEIIDALRVIHDYTDPGHKPGALPQDCSLCAGIARIIERITPPSHG